MAGELVAARTKIKTKLDIQDTTFDAMLLECIEQVIPRLAPYISYRIAEDTSVTLATHADNFTLPVANSLLDRMYIRESVNDVWREHDLWRQNRNTIYISEPISRTTYVKLIAHRPYTNTDADLALLMVDTPAALLPLYFFAMSEFATYIIGNKRKFNIYQQSNGVRTLDEMQQLSQFYENKAIRILEDELSAEGQ